MAKNDMFRKINERFPDIVEKAITQWGTRELDVYLLDLLSDQVKRPRDGMSEDIMAAISGLKAEHDREFPQYAAAGQAEALHLLDENEHFRLVAGQFPHIGRRLTAAWGKESFAPYMDSLFNDNRGGSRHGFPEPVMVALFRLVQMHELEFPQFNRPASDIWTVNNQA